MRKRLQLALMAIPIIATSLSLTTPYVQAESASGGTITATTDDTGRKVYVNDETPPAPAKWLKRPAKRGSSLMYWSTIEARWKPVPSANIRAARSAAAEVNQYLGTS